MNNDRKNELFAHACKVIKKSLGIADMKGWSFSFYHSKKKVGYVQYEKKNILVSSELILKELPFVELVIKITRLVGYAKFRKQTPRTEYENNIFNKDEDYKSPLLWDEKRHVQQLLDNLSENGIEKDTLIHEIPFVQVETKPDMKYPVIKFDIEELNKLISRRLKDNNGIVAREITYSINPMTCKVDELWIQTENIIQSL